ncbi:hypothetical protein Hdeb2414_s0006g00213281 [Helianthus debilis subsp. tardiflorus]
MGECSLKINIARFAVENSGVVSYNTEKGRVSGVQGQSFVNVPDNLRDSRSYSIVVGSSKDQGNHVKGGSDYKVEDQQLNVKSIIVPDRTAAFQELSSLALVGRTVNLETLVDFDRLLRIAKMVVTNIQLDGWSGQSLPYERVSWLKLCGIPLHLFSSEVMSQVGELFGKVLHVPKVLEEGQDLSVCRVGMLVGEVDRINEGVLVRWKNRSDRIWVEEDPNDWVPDRLGAVISPVSVEGSSPVSSSVVDVNGSDSWGNEETLHGDSGVGVEKPLGGDGAVPQANSSPVHEDRENGCNNNDVGTGSGSVEVEDPCLISKVVGPEVVGSFLCGSGERNNRPTRRRRWGPLSKKAQSFSQLNKEGSPVDVRRKKGLGNQILRLLLVLVLWASLIVR